MIKIVAPLVAAYCLFEVFLRGNTIYIVAFFVWAIVTFEAWGLPPW